MKNIKRIISILLCLCMVLGVVLTMTSCKDKNNEDDTSDLGGAGAANNANVEKIAVVRFTDNLRLGAKITEDKLELVELPATDVPLNAMKETKDIIGKFLTVPVYKGEFVFAGKLSVKAPSKSEKKEVTEDYLLVSDYMSAGSDVTAKLQQLINDNPGRTVYFPDGRYIITKPIEIPADPAATVSLRFSSYATLVAGPTWSGDAMIKLGTGEPVSNTSTSAYITGGVINANNKTTAISVVGGRDLFISDVTIKNAPVGIAIAVGTAYTDVENVHISGTGDSAVGLKIEGDGNTFTSMRITNVGCAVNVSGVTNTFRSIMTYYTGSSNSSKGFDDYSSIGNNYDGCSAVNYGTGYHMQSNTSSVYANCVARWDDAIVTQQYGFASAGQFNSVVRTCTVKVTGGDCAFVKASGGSGQVLYPVAYGISNIPYLQGGLSIIK